MHHVEIEKSTYRDSITLMRVSKKAGETRGIKMAVVAMGTDTNLGLLKDAGFGAEDLSEVSADDLVIALEAADETALEAALSLIQAELKGGRPGTDQAEAIPLSFERVLKEDAAVNLVLISVPGRFAAYEAHKALSGGKHVMIFSDNVAIEDEKRLKTMAREKGLLLMGPDCGTAIINGIGLGFANKVPRGPIGIVAASGTGAQEVSSILARHRLGISQLIGTGGRDLSPDIGGLTTLMGIEALKADRETEVIAVISKLPDPEVADRVLEAARGAGKPCVIYFAGSLPSRGDENLRFARTLAETALMLERTVSGSPAEPVSEPSEDLKAGLIEYSRQIGPARKYLRGLFSGGTLAQEAVFILGANLDAINTNLKMPGSSRLGDPTRSVAHTIVDLGDDTFTRGRAHPMIDQSYRLMRLRSEATDPGTAVILLDVVLGFGCNSDPAGEIAHALREIFGSGGLKPGHPVVIASICGTYDDPQDYQGQKKALESVGVFVTETNEQACLLAAEALKQ